MAVKRGEHLKAGFTLVEVLAAFAVMAMIIVGTSTLIHHVGLTFDRGLKGVGEAERFALTTDRLARDFGATHFVSLKSTAQGQRKEKPGNKKFLREPVAFSAQADKITFVSSGGSLGSDGGLLGLGSEVVTLSVETFDDHVSELVRRRAPWLGPSTATLDEATQDAVVLLQGRYDISFSFGRLAKDGSIEWVQSWDGETALPRLVRLNLQNPETGISLLAKSEFILHADAPLICTIASSCLSDTPVKDKPEKERQTL